MTDYAPPTEGVTTPPETCRHGESEDACASCAACAACQGECESCPYAGGASDAAGYRAAFFRVMERCDELQADAAEHHWTALEMARKADAAERRAEEAEYHVEQLRDARDRAERRAEELERVLAQVRWAFDLQCPPMPPDKYVDRGAWTAHSWWNTVLGGILQRAESGGVGTGAGEGATGQDTGTAWVTRSTDCPEAPAQAHPLDCDHEWLDRPESDTRECLICGTEVAG